MNDKAVKNDSNFLIVFHIQHRVFLTPIFETILDDLVQMSQRFLCKKNTKCMHSWSVHGELVSVYALSLHFL